MNADREFARKVVIAPADVIAGYRVTSTKEYYDRSTDTHGEAECLVVVGYDYYEDYVEGYAIGLKHDNVVAERHVIRLALDHEMVSNTPNNTLLGYIHGKHRREHGKDCLGAETFAAKCGRWDHMPREIVKQVVKGRAIRKEKREKWVSMRGMIDAQQLTWSVPSVGKSLGEVAGAALREILASK